jgi:hypothetical protein
VSVEDSGGIVSAQDLIFWEEAEFLSLAVAVSYDDEVCVDEPVEVVAQARPRQVEPSAQLVLVEARASLQAANDPAPLGMVKEAALVWVEIVLARDPPTEPPGTA